MSTAGLARKRAAELEADWRKLDEPFDMAVLAEALRLSGEDTVVREADVDRGRARDWVVFRAIDYWLWGLHAGLTEDPQRCERLVTACLA